MYRLMTKNNKYKQIIELNLKTLLNVAVVISSFFMEDILIEFQIFLNYKGFINNHDWDFEKEAKEFTKKRVVKPQKCKCRKATFTRTVDADFNCLCGKCGHPI